LEQLEKENRPWEFGATLLISALVFALFILVQTAVGVIFFVTAHLRRPDLDPLEFLAELPADGDLLTVATILAGPVAMAVIYGAIRTRRGMDWKEYLALQPIPTKTMLLWLGGAVSLAAASDGLTLLLGRPIVPAFIAKAYATATFKPLLALAFICVAPVFEEVFFRGFLFRGLEYTWLEGKGAVWVTSIAFGLVHAQYDLYGMLTAVALGAFLGMARWKTGSLRVTCSIGFYASVPTSAKEVNTFIDRADAALYHSKQNGRNCLTNFTDIA